MYLLVILDILYDADRTAPKKTFYSKSNSMDLLHLESIYLYRLSASIDLISIEDPTLRPSLIQTQHTNTNTRQAHI